MDYTAILQAAHDVKEGIEVRLCVRPNNQFQDTLPNGLQDKQGLTGVVCFVQEAKPKDRTDSIRRPVFRIYWEHKKSCAKPRWSQVYPDAFHHFVRLPQRQLLLFEQVPTQENPYKPDANC